MVRKILSEIHRKIPRQDRRRFSRSSAQRHSSIKTRPRLSARDTLRPGGAVVQTARSPNRSDGIMTSPNTFQGCESVRTRYDLFRTTGQGALIWSAIRVRHRPRTMHHKLLDFYIFRPRPCFPSFASHVRHYCSCLSIRSTASSPPRFHGDLTRYNFYLILLGRPSASTGI